MKKITLLLTLSVGICASIFAQSPYIHKVYDYRPAPGRFVNEYPEYETGDTQEDMNRKAEACISGENEIPITLGGYGGYVVFGFDHPIINVANSYDFKILGNAFITTTTPQDGGSCEPGIVMVSYDANGNGLPDDVWYELAGSEYTKPETIKNYQITYYKSAQPHYPKWIDDETLFFEGTKLADNGVDLSGTGAYYVLYAYPWGYADNYPNTDERSNFNIEWAVDAAGKAVHLPAIHFVKVYTGVNQQCGLLGEVSTEVAGAKDLHPNAVGINQFYQNKNTMRLLKNPVDDVLMLELSEPQTLSIYNALGQLVGTNRTTEGINKIDCSHLNKGVYIIISNYGNIKFIKQ
ncbi:MAG: T9SS type A sorting domain-containing protein [Bacteroidetes bacterium]|nr:T9SS type A sorting domain-containing protein [Bacteroidota bacterium]